MRAAVLYEAGGVPRVDEVDEPAVPEGGVLVEVTSAALRVRAAGARAGCRGVETQADSPNTKLVLVP
jgi:NADPH:quinone reductase-like Zn-dependent oxidoreductase